MDKYITLKFKVSGKKTLIITITETVSNSTTRLPLTLK